MYFPIFFLACESAYCVCNVRALRTHFPSGFGLSLESSLISEHVAILERQQPIDVRSFMCFSVDDIYL